MRLSHKKKFVRWLILFGATLMVGAIISQSINYKDDYERTAWNENNWKKKTVAVLEIIKSSNRQGVYLDEALKNFAMTYEELGNDKEHCDDVSFRRKDECLDNLYFSSLLSEAAESFK